MYIKKNHNQIIHKPKYPKNHIQNIQYPIYFGAKKVIAETGFNLALIGS